MVMILIVFLGVLFFPTGNFIFEVFSKGPFVAGPYIMLTLMFFVFALSISLLFVITFIVLFIQYTIIYERVSHNFKAVEHG